MGNNKEFKDKILNYFYNDIKYNKGFDLFNFIDTLSDEECDVILKLLNDNDDINE